MTLNSIISFFDLRLIFNQGSLGFLAKLFKLDHQKMEMEYQEFTSDYFEKNKEKIIDYCRNDCLITLDLFKKLKELIASFKYNEKSPSFEHTFSIPQLTINIFRELFLKDELKGTDDDEIYEIERAAYYGGISMNFKKFFESKEKGDFLYYYDINSSYPFSMTFPMPFEGGEIEEYKQGSEYGETDLLLVSFVSNSIIPCLPERIKGSLFYFRKGEKKWHWGTEIKIMEKYGKFQVLEIHKIIRYEPKIIFKEYIEFIYNKRKNSNDESERYWLKILMNSLYGKLGQRDFAKTYFLPSDCAGEGMPFGDDVSKFPHINFLPGNCVQIEVPEKTKKSIGRLVRFSGYIAAKSRSNLMNYIYQIGEKEIYYCDTDSFISKHQTETSNLLGGLKLEKKISYGSFIGPKFYEIYDENEVRTTKLKGIINSKEAFDLLNSENKKEITITNKGVFTRKFDQIIIEDQEKTCKIEQSRRKWLSENESIPFEDYNEYLKFK